MNIDTQKRQKILKIIYRIPSDKLNEIDEFISKFELEPDLKSKNLSFAGAWKNMDDSTFSEFTDNLISRRQKNSRRNNE
jgi:hypothetical protein